MSGLSAIPGSQTLRRIAHQPDWAHGLFNASGPAKGTRAPSQRRALGRLDPGRRVRNDRYLRKRHAVSVWSRRKPAIADRDRERRRWEGKRSWTSATWRTGSAPKRTSASESSAREEKRLTTASGARRNTNICCSLNGESRQHVFRSAAPPLMAGMNLGMSERNDTMAAHRSVVAIRNSNWAENKSNHGRHAFHASRKELTRRPLTGTAGVIAAATHTPLAVRLAGGGGRDGDLHRQGDTSWQAKRQVGNAGGECSPTE
jgi:hypothetical protein